MSQRIRYFDDEKESGGLVSSEVVIGNGVVVNVYIHPNGHVHIIRKDGKVLESAHLPYKSHHKKLIYIKQLLIAMGADLKAESRVKRVNSD